MRISNPRKVLSGYEILSALLGISIVIGILNPVFLSLDNLSNILLQASVIIIVSVGMTFVIISGGIDVSVGSIVGFSGMVLGYCLNANLSSPVAIGLCLLTGLVCGMLNGYIVAIFSVPPFIVTLGMMSAARGAALMVNGGRSFSGFSNDFLMIANGAILGIPLPIILMFVIVLLAYIALKYSYWGKHLFAIGGNPKASWLSGIQVKPYLVGIYTLCGLLCSTAGVVLSSRLNSTQPIAGNFYELDAIAAVVIGGASFSGGQGSVAGTLLGALILAVLKNGLSILNVPSFVQQITIGAVIVGAVIVDKWKTRD
jgi:ribose/xylose/arabinose/galactoside ABC-type transport system permease subunit